MQLVTGTCPVCGGGFGKATLRQEFCHPECRKKAHRLGIGQERLRENLESARRVEQGEVTKPKPIQPEPPAEAVHVERPAAIGTPKPERAPPSKPGKVERPVAPEPDRSPIPEQNKADMDYESLKRENDLKLVALQRQMKEDKERLGL